MKTNKMSKKTFAFSFAEVTVVFAIIAIITVISLKINKSRTDYEKSFLCYAAYKNLSMAVGELIAEGCTQSDVTSGYCTSTKSLPIIGHNAASRGLCDRLALKLNLINTANCTATATSNFSTATPNFVLSNGMRLFNLGSSAIHMGSNYVYDIYTDNNGTKGNAKLGEDVSNFNFLTNGTVALSGAQAIDTKFLKVNVFYINPEVELIPKIYSGVSFAAGFCASLGETTYNEEPYWTYCDGKNYNYDPRCNDGRCRIEVVKPGF